MFRFTTTLCHRPAFVWGHSPPGSVCRLGRQFLTEQTRFTKMTSVTVTANDGANAVAAEDILAQLNDDFPVDKAVIDGKVPLQLFARV